MRSLVVFFVGAFAWACSSSDAPLGALPPSAAQDDAGAVSSIDAGGPANPVGQTDAGQATSALGACASTFGSGLTAAFGRIDGKLEAIVVPNDQTCAMPNSDHLVLQVRMGGAVYRMVINVASDRGSDPNIRFGALAHELPAPAYEEGWHPGLTLDYVAMGAHSTEGFEALTMDAVVQRVIDRVRIGSAVSVYATSGKNRPESAHLVHRNSGKNDGAVVIGPDGPSPTFLLFHFANQSF